MARIAVYKQVMDAEARACFEIDAVEEDKRCQYQEYESGSQKIACHTMRIDPALQRHGAVPNTAAALQSQDSLADIDTGQQPQVLQDESGNESLVPTSLMKIIETICGLANIK
mmetsp:Transcript_152554/g.281131  ORF Transcript_152554/g.281131 Transcript_152554/m.281131 type:complete len:113 (-) Transcript_152554:496-834(-)